MVPKSNMTVNIVDVLEVKMLQLRNPVGPHIHNSNKPYVTFLYGF